jgi:hypothetical protein
VGSHCGWELICDGIDLVDTSSLAKWDGRKFLHQEQDYFNQYWPRLHEGYGRWFCWLAFGIGIENIIRGAFQVKQLPPVSFKATVSEWQALGIPANRIADHKIDIKRIAHIRNEGAHEFIAGVRNAYFPEVETKFVPALNLIMDAINAPAALKERAVVFHSQ